ncbi:MAG TPA: hypothetical protein VMK65_07415 [Longimicrobiales bacterium]|nr:hypothetical protein [Longimicrobiales bacterium]
MAGWCAIVLALREPEQDRLSSRLPTYLHPLAGRSLAWHVMRTLSELDPAPEPLLLVGSPMLDAAVTGEVPAVVVHTRDGVPWCDPVWEQLRPGCERVLLVDAAAPALEASLEVFMAGPAGRVLRAPGGEALALLMDVEEARERCALGATLEAVGEGLETAAAERPEEGFVVRDRAGLARAAALVRRRTVEGLMEGGVTFLAPESVIVDVDVQIGADTIIYPGVVLEGRTTIGGETVIGPGCRIIDAQVGSGVELKGYNYIVRTRIRNRAVLEPYVRRGFD